MCNERSSSHMVLHSISAPNAIGLDKNITRNQASLSIYQISLITCLIHVKTEKIITTKRLLLHRQPKLTTRKADVTLTVLRNVLYL